MNLVTICYPTLSCDSFGGTNTLVMDKLQLTGWNLDRVFNFRSGHLHAAKFWCYQ